LFIADTLSQRFGYAQEKFLSHERRFVFNNNLGGFVEELLNLVKKLLVVTVGTLERTVTSRCCRHYLSSPLHTEGKREEWRRTIVAVENIHCKTGNTYPLACASHHKLSNV
jgi:hypothetical protein